jgi:diadenylate cyclase
VNWLAETWVMREVLRPLLDVAILAFLIYEGYRILVQTRAVQLVKGALMMAVLYAVAFFLRLTTLLWILNMLAPGLVIGIAIVFQPELRKIFTQIGQGDWFRSSARARPYQIESVLNAVEVLAGQRRGCLVVFARNVGMKNIVDTGTRLNAELTTSLILTVFAHDTPLHDGAMVIQSGRILASGCFLPLSEQADIRRSFGTRHRAALGLAEETDAVTVVVSEETGAISLAYDANLYYDLPMDSVRRQLKDLLEFRKEADEEEEAEEVALED